MKSGRRWVALAVVLAFGGPAQAGFFDEIGAALFGSRHAPPEQVFAPGEPLDVTVRPRHRRLVPRSAGESRKVVNTAISPVDHPNWFLEDPTLRKGDVVVLKGQVLVFNGGRLPYTRSDFTALGESRLLSKSLRDKVRAMAGLPPADLAVQSSRAADLAARTVAALQ